MAEIVLHNIGNIYFTQHMEDKDLQKYTDNYLEQIKFNYERSLAQAKSKLDDVLSSLPNKNEFELSKDELLTIKMSERAAENTYNTAIKNAEDTYNLEKTSVEKFKEFNNKLSNLDEGMHVVDRGLNQYYTVQDAKLVNPQKLSTLDTYIIDNVEYKFNGKSLVDASNMFAIEDNDADEAKENKGKIEKKIYTDLKQLSPTLYEFIKKQKAPISSMGALLPIILDQATYFLNENTLRDNEKLRDIAKWLYIHKFTDVNYNVINKTITLQDIISFANTVSSYLQKQDTLSFDTLLGSSYTNTISKGVPSISEVFSFLRSEQKLNSAEKDKAINNFVENYQVNPMEANDKYNLLAKQILAIIRNSTFIQTINYIKDTLSTEKPSLAFSLSTPINVCLSGKQLTQVERALKTIQLNIINVPQLQEQLDYITKVLDKCSLRAIILEIDALKNRVLSSSIGTTQDVQNKEFTGNLSTLNTVYKSIQERLNLLRRARDLFIKNNPDKVSEYNTDKINNPGHGFFNNKGVPNPELTSKPAYSPIDSDVFKYFSNATDKTLVDDILNKITVASEPGKLRSLLHNLNNPAIQTNLQKSIQRNIIQHTFSPDATSDENKATVVNIIKNLQDARKELNKNLNIIYDLISEMYTGRYSVDDKSLMSDVYNRDTKYTEHSTTVKEYTRVVYAPIRRYLSYYTNILTNLNLDIADNTVDEVLQSLFNDKTLLDSVTSKFSDEYVELLNNFISNVFLPKANNFIQSVDSNLDNEKIVQKLDNKDLEKMSEFAKQQAEEIVKYLEQKVTQMIDAKATDAPDTAKNIDNEVLQYFSRFINSAFSRTAELSKQKYTLNDLDEVLSSLDFTADVKYTTKTNKSIEYTSELSQLERLANKLIKFLNIDSPTIIKDKLPELEVTDILSQIDELIANEKLIELYLPKDISIKYIKENKSILAALISDKLLNKKTQVLSIDDIVSQLLSSIKTTLPATASINDILIECDKAFTQYMSHITNSNVKGLLESAKFQILMNVADAFSDGNATNSLISIIDTHIKNLPNVENVFSAIKNQYKYRYLAENVKKSIANYKVIKLIEAKITNILVNLSHIKDILPNYFEYPDELIVNYLRKTGLYDLTYNVTTDPNSLKVCKDINVMQSPKDYVTIDFAHRPFKQLINKFKGIKQYNPLTNALVLTGLLIKSGYTKSALERTFRFIESSFAFKNLDSTLKSQYDNAKNTVITLLDELRTKAKEQADSLENLNSILNSVYTKYPNIEGYIKIDKHPYLLKKPTVGNTADIENVLPVRVEINTGYLNKYKEINDASNNLRQLISTIEYKMSVSKNEDDKTLLANLLKSATDIRTQFNSKLKSLAEDKNVITLPYLEKLKKDIESYIKDELTSKIKGTADCLELAYNMTDTFETLDNITSQII